MVISYPFGKKSFKTAPTAKGGGRSRGGSWSIDPPIGSLPAGYAYVIDDSTPPNYLIDDEGNYVIQEI
jgi:hypothetical protein